MQSTSGILDVAERLVQVRGYNGFSYADIAAELRVTKASLHYHFATKAELGRALIERYSTGFARALADIDGQYADPCVKLQRYVMLYEAVIRSDRMCLCGMLAAEVTTLPLPMQRRLNAYFDANEAWLTRVLHAGRTLRKMSFTGSATERARGMIGTLEGAMLVARMYGDARRFSAVANQAVASVCLYCAEVLREPDGPARPGKPRRARTRPRDPR
ncbi:MAG: helix-turn-helix domain-containing protein [Steroidobacteraceae bacterium]